MADRAEMFSLSTFHSLSPPGCRPPQDISLEEFDDEDLSEITDDCGLGLSYDSDHCEKDSLSLGRSEQPHPICSFQDDFQEFEMIDDNEEEEEDDDEEEEEEGDEDGKEGGRPSSETPAGEPLIPSPSLEESHKHRPTTLHLTTLGAQDSLNNNGDFAPALPASWQEPVLCSPVLEPLRELELSSDGGSSSSGRSSHLTNSIEEASSPASEPEPEPELLQEHPRRPAFLPVGPDDTNSEYESGSESEPDLSEDADSPWLLSNLVSRMISEGSSPIRCPGQCLSPVPRLPGDPASSGGGAIAESQDPEAAAGSHVELVDMETLCGPPPPVPVAPRPGPAQPGPCLFLSNPTRDTITPLWAASGRTVRPGRAYSAACSEEEDDEEEEDEEDAEDSMGPPGARGTGSAAPLDASLVYDAVKYTLVVDEHTQLELVSLRRCAGLSNDSEEDSSGEASEEEAGTTLLSGDQIPEDASPDSPDLTFSKKFLNVFVNSTSRSSSTESFGLFSCLINGEEREQTHRAVFRFIPRHPDELELDVDDPVLVEAEEDDFWFRGFNMRTGERGVFPAFYAHAVPGPAKDLLGSKRSPCWVERFDVQFLGSVEVPCHQGNGILCAAMQKIATARKLTVHLRPPASCDLEISLRGVKLSLSGGGPEFQRCSHFFQMKNISFCGCHPRNSCYFGFITKHPLLSRFACHVFVSQESMRPVAQSVGRAFLEYYQEHLAFACPTEDIYLE
uniref:C-Jun-amino-terminal kinase-interacting protein 2 isoform X2 n=1 Tax=Jaculus jaculus TaxID=51337 RepID=UPI001E1B302B|nr:C-Jun-amino-terminal kinase-interacting protein 2 isoform X2 [Jaculus jaculus]